MPPQKKKKKETTGSHFLISFTLSQVHYEVVKDSDTIKMSDVFVNQASYFKELLNPSLYKVRMKPKKKMHLKW